MKALTLTAAGHAAITEAREPILQPGQLLLKVEMVGLCGTDLNSFRGRNPLITYPRILGHEIAGSCRGVTERVERRQPCAQQRSRPRPMTARLEPTPTRTPARA